jgi:archaellum biogenesis ATPase FlaH
MEFKKEDQSESQLPLVTEHIESAKIIAIETGEIIQEASVKKPWIKSAKEIMEMGITEIPMLVKGLFPKYGMATLAGSSDLGKSMLLLQLTNAIINGSQSFLGFELKAEHRRAIYVSTEDDEYSICPRLINLSKSTEDKSVYERLEIITSEENLLGELDKLLTANPTDIVIADTLSDLYGGDMNQSNKVRFFFKDYKKLAHKHKTLFVFNHHCGKKNDFRPPHKDNLLGSQGIESSNRTVIELRKDFGDPSLRHLCLIKANHLDETSKNRSYVLKFDYAGDGFTNTGARVPFEQLAKSEGNNEQKISREQRVLQLRNEKKTIVQIHAIMKAEGVDIGRSTVGNICKAHPFVQPSNDGTGGQQEDGNDDGTDKTVSVE